MPLAYIADYAISVFIPGTIRPDGGLSEMPHPFDPCPHIERMPDASDVRLSASRREDVWLWSMVAIAVVGLAVLLWWIGGHFVEAELRRAVADQEVLLGSSYRSIAMARSVGL